MHYYKLKTVSKLVDNIPLEYNALISAIPSINTDYPLISNDKHIQIIYILFRNYISIFPEYLDTETLIILKYMTDKTPLYPTYMKEELKQLENQIEKENTKTMGGKRKTKPNVK